ncbi:MAG: BLUF domain-containing protein [Pseudomonadota bacterium]
MSATAAVQKAEPCYRLIYRSRSLLSEQSGNVDVGLSEILRVARSNNRKHDITGALMMYEHKDWFAQVLEGNETEINTLFERIRKDPRHKNVEVIEAGNAPARLFGKWAMALIAEHGEPDAPLVATDGGISEAAPWRVTQGQENVLTQLRDMTRGYGRSY